MSTKPVVLVTGASRGIGRAIARSFAEKKYRVGINYVQSDDKASALADEVRSLGGEAMVLKADVGNSAQVKKTVDRILRDWDRLDVLINNAGIARDRTILKMSDEEWNESVRVNLSGAFWCLRECAKVMAAQMDGSIINISSLVGLRGGIGNANYAAVKAGILGLTKGAARELGRYNVRVNAIMPGFHPTDLSASVWNKYAGRIRAEHALGRITDIEELGRFVVTIAEQKSASGQVFNFDSRVI